MKRWKRNAVIVVVLSSLISLAVFVPLGSASSSSPGVEVKDQELVLCETNSAGTIEGVQVIETLSLKGEGSVDVKKDKDISGGLKFSGMSGFAKPSVEGDYIVWKGVGAGGNSNHVATTKFSKEQVEQARLKIPLKVEYRYYLDGKEMKPEEMKGKSGHFRLELKLANRSAEKRVVKYKDPDTGQEKSESVDVYLPLVVQPYDWKFDNQRFFNFKTDPTGILFAQPNCYQPGWSIPLFPPATDDTFTIWVEADVKDFSMPTLTLVVAFVFPETNQKNAAEEMGPALEQLYDGIKQLDAGLQQAAAGVGSATTPDTLLYGITQIYDGLLQVVDPVEGLPYAKSMIDTKFIPGVLQAIDGLDQLIAGMIQISAGISHAPNPPTDPGGIKEGLLSMKNALDTAIIPNLQNIASNLDPGNPASVHAAVNAVNVEFTVDNFPQPPPATTMLAWVNHNAAYGGTMNAADIAFFTGKMSGLSTIALVPALNGIAAMYGGLSTGIIPGLQQISAGMGNMLAGIGDNTTPGTLLFGCSQILNGLITMKSLLRTGSEANPGFYEGLELLSEGLGEAIAGFGSANTANTLLWGTAQIRDGLTQLGAGLTQATGGTAQMVGALGPAVGELNLTFGELEAIKQRAEEFNSILGPVSDPKGTTNEVRFAFQTKPTYPYQDSTTASLVAIILSVIIIIALVLAGLFAFRRIA